MSAIGPGDQVQCVQSGPGCAPAVGAIYRVAAIRTFGFPCTYHVLTRGRCDQVGLVLVGVVAPGREHPAFCSTIFRPIGDQGARFIESLNIDIPARAPAELETA